MSSTNRGTTRAEQDYYVTPIPAIRAFLEAWAEVDGLGFLRRVLDPAAGGDDERPMSYPTALQEVLGWKPDTLDIREDSRAAVKADYLTWQAPEAYDLIITNPPFALAEEFINKAIGDVHRGGRVAMLLRLNFLGSRKRLAFWREHMPRWIFVHHERMSFTPDGRTDSIEYMHAVWVAGEYPAAAELRVI